MTKKVGQGLIGTLALIALAVGGIDSAYATSDKKPAAKVTEPAAAKPVAPRRCAADRTRRGACTASQAAAPDRAANAAAGTHRASWQRASSRAGRDRDDPAFNTGCAEGRGKAGAREAGEHAAVLGQKPATKPDPKKPEPKKLVQRQAGGR